MTDAKSADVLILATLETKREAVDYLAAGLCALGVKAEYVDLSLDAGGAVLDGEAKMAAMQASAERAERLVRNRLAKRPRVVVGFGGGTGSQMALSVIQALPFGIPKLLVTTMPFDPRPLVISTDIVLVPTIADIMGLNAMLRGILDTVAAMAAGVVRRQPPDTGADASSVALTAMGITAPGIDQVVARLRSKGAESTVFHAVSYGGAALENWLRRGAFSGVLDFTPHEITRILFGGRDAAVSRRFEAAAASGLPVLLVPGGLNLHCLGPIQTVDKGLLRRPHYRHSAAFTHVQLSEDEMQQCVRFLCEVLGPSKGPLRFVVPRRGFSTEDRQGGAIESPALCGLFIEGMTRSIGRLDAVVTIDAHLNDPAFTDAVADAYLDLAGSGSPS